MAVFQSLNMIRLQHAQTVPRTRAFIERRGHANSYAHRLTHTVQYKMSVDPTTNKDIPIAQNIGMKKN